MITIPENYLDDRHVLYDFDNSLNFYRLFNNNGFYLLFYYNISLQVFDFFFLFLYNSLKFFVFFLEFPNYSLWVIHCYQSELTF